MKYRESCSCGASLEIEAMTSEVIKQVADWRARHKHQVQHPPLPPRPWQPQPFYGGQVEGH